MSDDKHILSKVIDMPFNREEGMHVFINGNRDNASKGLPDKPLNAEQQGNYLGLKNVIGQIIGAYAKAQLQDVPFEPSDYISWARDFVIWVKDTPQREEVSDEIIEELVRQAEHLGTELCKFLKRGTFA